MGFKVQFICPVCGEEKHAHSALTISHESWNQLFLAIERYIKKCPSHTKADQGF